MKIELRNVQYYPRLSEETKAFTANLYINGVHAGLASNEGHGGPTSYRAKDETGKGLIVEAEAYCKTLPPGTFLYDGAEHSYDMTLEAFIDDLVDSIVLAREQQKADRQYQKTLEKIMENGVAWGTDESYRAIAYKMPLNILLASETGRQSLVKTIKEKVLPQMKPGETIRNTNIPEAIFKEAGLKPGQYLSSAHKAPKRQKRTKRKGI